MCIERWFGDAPSEIVNEVALSRRYIVNSIHAHNALGFKQQDYIIKEINYMSRKVKEGTRNDKPTTTTDKKTGTTSKGSGTSTRWASADIRTATHKTAIREMASQVEFVLDTIVELIDDGYELHVKRTDSGSTVRSMLFCKDRNSHNANGGLSAEAPDAWLSLTALIYKHSTVLDGKWFEESDEGEEDNLWK